MTNTLPAQTAPPTLTETIAQTTAQAVTGAHVYTETELPETAAPAPATVSFEQCITDGLANWSGSNVDASTLVFSGNSCTVTANASGSPLSCTLKSNAVRTAFTLVMVQSSPAVPMLPTIRVLMFPTL